MTENTGVNQETSNSNSLPGNLQLTDELVEKITERVYRMLLADLRLEFERGRGYLSDTFHRGLS